MRWSLEWGPHLKALEARKRRTGQTPLALLKRPKLQRHDARYIDAFKVLDRSRCRAFEGFQPISLTEMKTYFETFYITGESIRRRYVEVLQALDGAFLDYHAERAEARRKQAGSTQP